MIVEELNAKWNETVQANRGGHEWRGVALSVRSPVRLLAAVREPDNRKALLIEGPLNLVPVMRIRFETHGLSLTEQRRPDEGIVRLGLVLERSELEDIFQVLCGDLVTEVSRTTNPGAAFSAATKRLEAWQACLLKRKGALSHEEQVGLLGELILLQMMAELIGYPAAVEAWKGPMDGTHDFVEKGTAIEVKSVLGVGTYIHISNVDQLEFMGLSSLTIARLRFREAPNGKSLPTEVQTVRSSIENISPATVPEFENKLLRVGYLDVDNRLYSSIHFVQEDICFYAVDREFPRIVRAELSSAIVGVSYAIDEAAIPGFRRGHEYLNQILSVRSEAGNG